MLGVIRVCVLYPIENREPVASEHERWRERERPLESGKDSKICTPALYENIIIQIS